MKNGLTVKYLLSLFSILTLYLACIENVKANNIDTSNYKVSCNQGVFDLCGYHNNDIFKKDKTIEWLIKPEFEKAFNFSDGLAAVKLNGKFGFIDPSGKFKIKPKFKSVGLFYKGLAPFYEDEKIGFINTAGKVVVPPKFYQAVSINENIILGSEANSRPARLIKGKLPSLSGRYSFLGSKNMGIYSIQKGWMTEQKFSFSTFNKENYDLFWAREKDSKTGLMRPNGKWHIKPSFVHTQTINDGLAIIRIKDKDGTVLSGAVDQNGDLAIPTKFEWLGYWVGEYGLARQGHYSNGKHGLVNKSGTLLGGRYFDEVERPDHSFKVTKKAFLPRVKSEGIWHSITPDGKLIEDQKKGPILSCDNFIISRSSEGLTAKDKSGKIIAKFDYQKYFSFYIGPHTVNLAHRCDAPLRISSRGKYGFILPEGLLFAGQFFDSVAIIFENVVAYSQNKKWGLIDASGRVILKPLYNKIGWYGDERFVITHGEDKFLVDKTGKRYELADDPNYNMENKIKFPPREKYLDCGKGGRLKSQNGKWGLVTKNNKIILPYKYRALHCYVDGFAWAPKDELQKWCPINRDGKFASAEHCITKKYPWFRWHYYPKKLDENNYESSVLWNLQYLNYGEGRTSSPPILDPDRVSAQKPIFMSPGYN